MDSGWSVSWVWEWAMAGRVFGMGAFRRFTVVRACTSGPMVWEYPGPAERAHQATAGEPARLDNGLVAR